MGMAGGQLKETGRKLSQGGPEKDEATESKEWFGVGFIHLCGSLTFPFSVKESERELRAKDPSVRSPIFPSSSAYGKCT